MKPTHLILQLGAVSLVDRWRRDAANDVSTKPALAEHVSKDLSKEAAGMDTKPATPATT